MISEVIEIKTLAADIYMDADWLSKRLADGDHPPVNIEETAKRLDACARELSAKCLALKNRVFGQHVPSGERKH
jgi:hypothetical protein